MSKKMTWGYSSGLLVNSCCKGMRTWVSIPRNHEKAKHGHAGFYNPSAFGLATGESLGLSVASLESSSLRDPVSRNNADNERAKTPVVFLASIWVHTCMCTLTHMYIPIRTPYMYALLHTCTKMTLKINVLLIIWAKA